MLSITNLLSSSLKLSKQCVLDYEIAGGLCAKGNTSLLNEMNLGCIMHVLVRLKIFIKFPLSNCCIPCYVGANTRHNIEQWSVLLASLATRLLSVSSLL